MSEFIQSWTKFMFYKKVENTILYLCNITEKLEHNSFLEKLYFSHFDWLIFKFCIAYSKLGISYA